jgi:YHYH protein
MPNKNFLKIILTPIFLLSSIVLFAHPDGHFHKGDGTVFNNWILKTGEVVKGNFSMGRDGIIMLEQEEGKMVKIAVADLSLQDQQLANFKIKKFERMNIEFMATANAAAPMKNSFNYSFLFLSILLGISTLFIFYRLINTFNKLGYNKIKLSTISAYLMLMVLSTYACKKSTDAVVTVVETPVTAAIPLTRVSFIDSAYAPYKPAISTFSDANYFHINSGGFPVASGATPAHNMMVGITSWQQQVPIPQNYIGTNSWSIPLQPVYAAIPASTKTNFMKGAIAVAANGMPIFNALNNRGEDAFLFGELDNWGGHCGKADDYHYHTAPLHLSSTSGLLPIAFALDGFAVYGAKEADGSTMAALDTCHGHIYNNGTYHYHGTTTYPYIIGAMKGKVTSDPSTPAPENQILPQAFPSPLRPPYTPLQGAQITAFASTGTNAYKLTYKVGAAFGYIEYNWNTTNLYAFKYTTPAGLVTTTNYQR